jgi:hypothetical protein
MEEMSAPPIPGSSLAEDHRQPRAHAAPRPLEKKPPSQRGELETNEHDEPVENTEQDHHVDISV